MFDNIPYGYPLGPAHTFCTIIICKLKVYPKNTQNYSIILCLKIYNIPPPYGLLT